MRPEPWSGARHAPHTWQRRALSCALAGLDAGRRGIITACTGAGKSVVIAELCMQLVGDLAPDEVLVVLTATQLLVDDLAGSVAERVGAGRVGRYFADAKDTEQAVLVSTYASAPALAAALRALGRRVRLLLCDEVHRSETDRIREAVDTLNPLGRVGFTATPQPPGDRDRLQLFDAELLRYTLPDALRDGVVVPWRIVPPRNREDRRLDDVVAEMILLDARGPTACNASSIEDAEQYSARLERLGLQTTAIHSRLDPRERASRMDWWRDGGRRVAVYPSLLREGVNLPWLVTIALRLDTQSAIRFLQELGRVLRRSPGKTEAIVLDPHGLAARFRYELSAELGAAPALDREALGEAEAEQDTEEDRFRRARVLGPCDQVATWAGQLGLAADVDRLIVRVGDRARREGPPTDRQLAALQRLALHTRGLPPGHRELARQVIAGGAISTARVAEDLLDVLAGLEARAAPWVPSLPVFLPEATPEALVTDLEAGGLEAAGVVWAPRGKPPRLAVVVRRGHRVLHRVCRFPARGEDSTSAAVEALLVAGAKASPGETIRTCDRAAAALVQQPVQMELGGRRAEQLAAFPRGAVAVEVASDLAAKRDCYAEIQRALQRAPSRRYT